MNVLRKLRILSVVLAFAVLAGQLCVVNVNAAQGVEQAPAGTKLSGFRITDLDRPVAGKDLDFTARVRTSENVTWEIPVIWTDENGNTVYTAKPGHTYYPNFAFYIPQGYSIDPKALAGKMLVKLPDFLIELYGTDSVLFASDASLGITYITFTQAVEAASKGTAALEKYEMAPAPAVNIPKPEESRSASAGDGSSSAAAPAPVSRISETVRVHCSQDVIDKFSNCPEVLEGVVTLIKNKLQPQAVALLSNAFDAFGKAEDRESAFGKEIGLYIYNKEGNIENVSLPDDAIAYVWGRYDNYDVTGVYRYILAIDTDSFMEQDENGIWRYKKGAGSVRDNTIVHEMMHAYMDDFTRKGMSNVYDRFPSWFTEGMAVTVENAYQYRALALQSMGNLTEDKYNKQLKRFEDTVTYTASSVTARYTSEQSDKDHRYALGYSNTNENLYSAYASGYLAVVYLGYLTAVHEDIYNGSSRQIDTASIRNGLSKILTWIHNGSSLDSVIRYISTPDSVLDNPDTYTDNERTHYQDTAAFESAFIQGPKEAGQEGYAGAIFTTGNTESANGREVLGSSQFVATYLNYLESQSEHGAGLDCSSLANGSLLKDDQHYESPLNTTDEPKPGIYVITDKPGAGGMVASTADNSIAYDHSGGKSRDYTGDLPAAQSGTDNVIPLDSNSGAAAAADRAESSDDTSDQEDAAPSSSGTEDTVAEPVVQEMPEQSLPADDAATAPESELSAESTDIPVAEGLAPVDITPETPVTDEDTVILPDTGDLIVLPQDIDAITPEEIVPAVSEPVSEEVTPSTDSAPSPDEGSSDGGSDGGSDDGGSSDEGGSDEGGSAGEE